MSSVILCGIKSVIICVEDYTLQAFLKIHCYFHVAMCYRDKTALINDNEDSMSKFH